MLIALKSSRSGLRAGHASTHIRTLLRVCLLDRLLDLTYRHVAGDYGRDLEEARLHDRVDTRAHADLRGDGVCVDRVELEFLVADLLLHLARDRVPDLVRRVGTVEEEDAPWLGHRKHVDLLEELKLVACHEVGGADEICGLDSGRGPKRRCDTVRLPAFRES